MPLIEVQFSICKSIGIQKFPGYKRFFIDAEGIFFAAVAVPGEEVQRHVVFAASGEEFVDELIVPGTEGRIYLPECGTADFKFRNFRFDGG